MLIVKVENDRNAMLVDIPCKRMLLAEHLASIGISAPASDIKCASRGGAVVARWAHNPKAGGSIPSPATFEERFFLSSFCFISPAYK